MSCCMDKMEYKKYQPKWDCEPKYEMDCDMDNDMDCCDMDYSQKKGYMPKMDYCDMDYPEKKSCMPKMGYMPHQHMMGHMPMDCCDMSMPKCKTEKTCVKTFKCTYKLYKVCSYKLYKVCPRCGNEYDYYRYPTCNKCR